MLTLTQRALVFIVEKLL